MLQIESSVSNVEKAPSYVVLLRNDEKLVLTLKRSFSLEEQEALDPFLDLIEAFEVSERSLWDDMVGVAIKSRANTIEDQ